MRVVDILGEEGGREEEDEEEGEGEEELLLKGYVSCLAKATAEEEEGEGGREGGKEIMPGAESTPTAEELEERCVAQDLVIAQLKAKLQTLTVGGGKARKGGREGGREEGVEGKVKRLEEENESMRSCMSTVVSVMEEVRRCASSSSSSSSAGGGSSAAAAAAAAAGSPPSLPSSASAQQLVNAVDDAASRVKARLRDLETELQASKEGGKEGKATPTTTLTTTTAATAGNTTPALPPSLPPHQHAKISFREFNVGDVALFLPTSHQGENRVYLAFHTNCPHRYLSHESLEGLRGGREGGGGGRFPDFILGKIVYVEEMVAKEGEPGSNPYHLQAGVKFYVLHVSNEVV